MASFNYNNTQINQNCNYSASDRVGNSNTKSVPLFWTTRYVTKRSVVDYASVNEL